MTNERLMDLVRYARCWLFDEEVISDEEYAALALDPKSKERVARLEEHDAMRAKIARLREVLKRNRQGHANTLRFRQLSGHEREGVNEAIAEIYEALKETT